MKDLLIAVSLLLSASLPLFSEVTILASCREDAEIISLPVDEKAEKLVIYLPAGKSYTGFQNLDRLRNLKTLIFPGRGYSLENDDFLKSLPQLEVLILKSVTGPHQWASQSSLKKLKVFIHRAVGVLPHSLEFAPGAELDFVGLQNLDNLPYLTGYKSIKILDLSSGIFPIPPPGTFESQFRNVKTIPMDGFVYPEGPWAPPMVKFRGVDFYYTSVYRDADY